MLGSEQLLYPSPEIGRLALKFAEPLAVDIYMDTAERFTTKAVYGGWVVVDTKTNQEVGREDQYLVTKQAADLKNALSWWADKL